jgi:hypothetical protein
MWLLFIKVIFIIWFFILEESVFNDLFDRLGSRDGLDLNEGIRVREEG